MAPGASVRVRPRGPACWRSGAAVQGAIGGGLRDQQHEQQIHRRAVYGVEIHWCFQAQNGTERRIAASHATVRNGYAIAEASRSEFFAGDQAFEDGLSVEVRKVLGDHLGDLFEDSLLAAAWDVHQGTSRGQDIFQSNHD